MYIIEGIIGAGKTTFLKYISKTLPHIAVTLEPQHHWQTENSNESLLNNFYQDPHRWAYTMETLTMIYRAREHRAAQQNKNPLALMERSVYSGHYVFAHNDYAHGFMCEAEWSVYNQWFNFFVAQKCTAPKGFIYLDTKPEIALERIKKRSRKTETSITVDYLRQIEKQHQAFLVRKEGILPELQEVPVLVLNCNEDIEEKPNSLTSLAAAVDQFIQSPPLKGKIHNYLAGQTL